MAVKIIDLRLGIKAPETADTEVLTREMFTEVEDFIKGLRLRHPDLWISGTYASRRRIA